MFVFTYVYNFSFPLLRFKLLTSTIYTSSLMIFPVTVMVLILCPRFSSKRFSCKTKTDTFWYKQEPVHSCSYQNLNESKFWFIVMAYYNVNRVTLPFHLVSLYGNWLKNPSSGLYEIYYFETVSTFSSDTKLGRLIEKTCHITSSYPYVTRITSIRG